MRHQTGARQSSGRIAHEQAGAKLPCANCTRSLPVSSYGTELRPGVREHTVCRECREERRRCNKCERIRPLRFFRWRDRGVGDLRPFGWCRDCERDRRGERREEAEAEPTPESLITATWDRERRAYTAEEWALIEDAADAFGTDTTPDAVIRGAKGGPRDPNIYARDEDGEIRHMHGKPIVLASDQTMVARQAQMLATALVLYRERQEVAA